MDSAIFLGDRLCRYRFGRLRLILRHSSAGEVFGSKVDKRKTRFIIKNVQRTLEWTRSGLINALCLLRRGSGHSQSRENRTLGGQSKPLQSTKRGVYETASRFLRFLYRYLREGN